ncbi:MAG: ABC transporter ATP-binding protein, partial [Gammaproteobacteria bacterium]|nr:ABC transporter ATP-binding protein [Gammaproteobacteria bacterium]
NGAGKTTLFRVASRVLRPDAGRVLARGRPLAAFSRRELAREVGVVPQDATIAFPFTAGEVVLMGRTPHLGLLGFETPGDVARARDAMARVGIEELADRSVLELSGGERQLVLFAMALMNEPRVLLLDEPTAGINPTLINGLIDRLKRANSELGITLLVIEHNMRVIMNLADHIYCLAHGEILAEGAPEDVQNNQLVIDAYLGAH